MGTPKISLHNGNLLLRAVQSESLFGGVTDYYEIAASSLKFKPDAHIYLYPGEYPTIKISGEDYTIAKIEDILGILND